jgi:hypothetical protein
MKKLTKSERQAKRRARKERNEQNMTEKKARIKAWLGLGGEFSTLELVVMAHAKLDIVIRGDIHPNGQIDFLIRKIEGKQRPVKNVRTKKDFYSSRLWKILRYQAFEKYGNKCQCCGGTPQDDLTMHVDHVKPRSTHPELELDINNLQVLCEDCNIGKLNQWDTN